VAVFVSVGVAVLVLVAVAVLVDVAVLVLVGVEVGVFVAVGGTLVAVAVLVGVGDIPHGLKLSDFALVAGKASTRSEFAVEGNSDGSYVRT
jgi:hypothetical protein